MTTYNLGHVVGEKGEKGDQGERGPQGPKGDKGDPGEGVTIVTSWSSTLSDSKIPSEKLAKNTLDTKQATLVSGSNIKTINNTSILGSGNIDIQGTGVDIDTSFPSTPSDTHVPSTKLVKNSLPTKLSDLTNDSDFIETSSTTGLIKNDGSIMTSGTGSTNYSAGNHTHSGYVSATKVTSWSSTVSDSNVPSEKLVKDTIDALEDLIGDAIDYINL